MTMNYDILEKELLLESLRKALKKNSKELPPINFSYEQYVDVIYNEIQNGTFKFDSVIKFTLPFGDKILKIDRCSLKNRVVEYSLAKKIYYINKDYWYEYRNNIFRTGSGLNEYVRNAKRFRGKYEYYYIIDLKHAFGINYIKLREDFLIKNLTKEQVELIDKALFSENDIKNGLPFGHKLSNILFDCNLIEIEKELTTLGYKFLRLIDSFMFFTNFKTDIEKINKIFERNKIRINEKKSKVVKNDEFIEYEKEILI